MNYSRAVSRVAARYAARPIHLDRKEIQRLVVRVGKAFARLPGQEEPLGVRLRPILDSESIFIRDIHGNTKEILIFFTSSRSTNADWVLGGGFGHVTRGLKKGMPLVIVNLNGKYPISSFTHSSVLEGQLYTVLAHELTHAADVAARPTPSRGEGGHIPSESEHGDLSTYYNSPHEIRAYMREIYEEIRPLTLKMMGMPLGQKWGLGKVIRQRLQGNPTWEQIRHHLTSKSKNRILKGIVTAFNDELSG